MTLIVQCTIDPAKFGLSAGSVESPLPWGRVALLGIADRTRRATFRAKLRQSKQFKPLVLKVKSVGDAIRAARQAKNLTPGYLAAKVSSLSRWY